MTQTKLAITTSISLALASSLFAVDAGTIQRDIEKNLEKQSHPQQTKPQKIQTVDKEEGIKTVVKSFNFTGNTIVSSDELQAVVAPYIGKELSFGALQKVVALVSDFYAEKGGLAKVYLPKQDITEGTIIIAIIEGKLNSVIIDNKEARLSIPKAENYIYSQNAKGTPIKNKELSRALMNLNDMGGIKASSSLAPGASEGSSDLVVRLKDGEGYTADFGVDNYGSLSTGKVQYNAGFSVNNLSKSDLYDNLNVRAMVTEGVRFSKVAWNVPVGYYGDKVGASLSGMTYRLLQGNYNSTDGDGYSTTAGINWSHPFIRTKEFNVNLNNEFTYKRYGNIVSSALTSIKKVKSLASSLSTDRADAFMGGGQTNLSLGLVVGSLDLKGLSSNYDTDQTTAKTNGSYLKYSVTASRIQTLTDELSLQASLQMQSANKNLDGSEELSLGGAYGVRAYPTSEASGDLGYMANIELRYSLNDSLTTSLFYDQGNVTINKTTWSGAGMNSHTLGGYGIGTSYTTKSNLNLKALIAKRTMTGYDPNSNGTNSDGSKQTTTRCWLNATYFF
jgi:hemolysin activation/secretion protein